MIKKIVLSIFWICGFTVLVSAQTFTNSRILNQAALGFRLAHEENYAKALAMANKKGWSLSFNTSNGNKAHLVGVDNFGYPQYLVTNSNVIAAATTRANQLWPGGSSGLNLSGSSNNMKNKIGIWDGGAVLSTHVELIGRVTQKDNPTDVDDHATHVSGTMIASGVNPAAKGMAFGAQGLLAYSFFIGNDITQMTNEAAAGLLLSNHSYGFLAGWTRNESQNNRWEFRGDATENEDYKFGTYGDYSQFLDSIAYNAPFYLVVRSAGNNRNDNGPAVGSPYFRFNASGQMIDAGTRPAGISSNDSYDIIPFSATAKNILTVGAVSGIPAGYSKKEDVILNNFSSWGPTDDGRIKPDIVADGINVLSSISTSNSSYGSLSGTSMSTPNTSGSLLLLQEYYSKLKGSTSFLRSATLKGLAIHTADEAGPSNGPDYQFGWGLLNVLKAANVITAAVPSNNSASSVHQLYENTLTQGQTFTLNVIASGKGQLQATICWTDVKGTVITTNKLNNRTKQLVNDLDIRITKGTGSSLRTYLPWTLNINNPSAAAVPGDNTTDNVERIDIDSTLPGQSYTITITHKGTLARGSQAYSLLISGVGGTAYCTSNSGGGGARIDSVIFKNISVGNSTGSKTYTNNTNIIADIEAGQTVPIKIKLNTADATTNARIVKVFMDFNNNGSFEVGELVSTSGALTSAAQLFTGSVTTPSTLTIGNTILMRIVVQETSSAASVLSCGAYSFGETQDYSLRVVTPSNDLAITEIVSPGVNDCANNALYVTINIRNNGSVAQSNIPLAVNIATGSTSIANLSFVYPGPIESLSTVTYTFQTSYVTAVGTNYTITASVNQSNDQFPANNTFVSSILTGSKPAAPTASGGICGTNASLKVNNPDASNYFWFTTPAGTTPFATGSTASTTIIPSDKTFYVQKEARVSIGPANKSVFPLGGYNIFTSNYVKINNSVPLTIETVRLYIGYPGQVRFTLANLVSETSTNFTYNRIGDPVLLDVYATRPVPVKGAVTTPDPLDTGAIYRLNMSVPTLGDHIIIIECLNSLGAVDDVNGATIFRNNGITTSTTYPIGVSNIIQITGNSAHTGTAQEWQFYYFFYDMIVNSGACRSDRVAVVATLAVAPVITQQADSLVSNIASGNQWFLDDVAITGATSNHFKPSKAGKYKVSTLDAFGCSQTSNTISFGVTATNDVLAAEIKLNVSPNPNRGVFNLSFEVNTKADLSIDILSSSGQRVYTRSYPGFTGKFSKQIQVDNISSEFYLLKIQHNKKTYVQKILVQK